MTDVTKTTLKRIASAAILLPIYLFAIISDGFYLIPILIISILISSLMLAELKGMTKPRNTGKPFFKTSIIGCIGLNVIMYLTVYGKQIGLTGNLDLNAVLGYFAIFTAVVMTMQVFLRPIEGSVNSMGHLFFALFFISFAFAHIILMKALPYGKFYIIILNIVVMANDSGAYFGGVLFGKHKVGFEVSPNKSWEGYIAGLLTSIGVMIGANAFCKSVYSVTLFSLTEAILLGALLSVLANVGDLIESVVKRDSKVKDSGAIIPGHGGMWDTMDAVTFALPVFYYFLIFIK